VLRHNLEKRGGLSRERRTAPFPHVKTLLDSEYENQKLGGENSRGKREERCDGGRTSNLFGSPEEIQRAERVRGFLVDETRQNRKEWWKAGERAVEKLEGF